MLSVFSCCCPTAFGRSKSIRLNELDLEGSSAAIGMEPVDEDGRDKSPSSTRGSPPMARRRVSTHTRRRAAVTSETTEQLASVRWRSAFDAVRRSESKSPEALAQIIGVLRSHELFASVDESLQTEVAQAMHERLAREGEAVISQGDAGDKFYVVAKGTLAAYVGSPDGSSFVCVGRMGPGDSFGELALLYDAPRAATVSPRALPVASSLEPALRYAIQLPDALCLPNWQARTSVVRIPGRFVTPEAARSCTRSTAWHSATSSPPRCSPPKSAWSGGSPRCQCSPVSRQSSSANSHLQWRSARSSGRGTSYKQTRSSNFALTHTHTHTLTRCSSSLQASTLSRRVRMPTRSISFSRERWEISPNPRLRPRPRPRPPLRPHPHPHPNLIRSLATTAASRSYGWLRAPSLASHACSTRQAAAAGRVVVRRCPAAAAR